ncbi:hypothetical protein SAMN06296036_11376 [Pseudobacteriovorax antillogorgiicola]|uniref:Uncharacterized protein n=1 Tax=Pseudobacteriovorax antillogorgiicola TaxID=1513793 RepID=A0A1Y6C8Y4_9BACT|nr:hypothetical protein EDD56_11477 [Pseudobacteriovorax antillogorgiicola]SMF43389.1 hypothetical protein SAMN06296036_11376 [Pseudobacteriovorax antillogorgiicola]
MKQPVMGNDRCSESYMLWGGLVIVSGYLLMALLVGHETKTSSLASYLSSKRQQPLGLKAIPRLENPRHE